MFSDARQSTPISKATPPTEQAPHTFGKFHHPFLRGRGVGGGGVVTVHPITDILPLTRI